MKCGFCMSVCPVYSVDHVESHVARGRNVIVNMASTGSFPMVSSYKDLLYFCLLCGRCQSVCPAMIPSPRITINARGDFIKKRGLGLVQRIVYKWLLFDRNLLASFVRLVSHLPGISKKDSPPLRHLADTFFLLSRQISIPKISVPFLSERVSRKNLAEKRGKIALFPGCAFEFFFPYVGEKMIRSLRKLGLDVVYPYGLGCCGFPVYCAGDIDTARKMAIRNIKLLKGYDKIITGCATCASALKGYKDWFDNGHKSDAEYVSSRVMVFSEFLIKENVKIKSSISHEAKITYHDPCHMIWHQGIYDEPRQIISSIRGARFVEMKEPGMCCGLGGSFGITHREISLEIQKRKIDLIKDTGAEMVVTECPGCMIQLQEGLIRKHLPIKAVHIAELL